MRNFLAEAILKKWLEEPPVILPSTPRIPMTVDERRKLIESWIRRNGYDEKLASVLTAEERVQYEPKREPNDT